ncbi:MAG: nucleotide sugar dehydrogenase [Alphaproteobacteria bacterium]|uniref:nucleotide sugar dehydrogenase n=1 Tax=Bradyrhizobium sp. TaxID=376 RepID=UPI001ECABD5A|nr:nucleotide sugar dehydrogenase [Bradyrhizobium sp.]MBV9570820.1 nucleotide sugar dehydrogenase [Alphaproteobacteria bacterium]MBV9979070.1 nucleotide sugar dehydrogenase [Bradyrhizobium sp.]
MNIRVALGGSLDLQAKLESRTLTLGVIGLGYVGLPLTHAFWQAGVKVLGFDIDEKKVEKLNGGISYINHFASDKVEGMTASGRFRPTSDFSELTGADAILICVPTPLNPTREPDLQAVVSTCEAIAAYLRPEHLIVLESTTYPGTTSEVVLPILETSGLKAGRDFYLAFSPEREDPGSKVETHTIPKIVGGWDERSGELATQLYTLAFERVYRVKDAQTAEAVKITENIFRAVNIALVNELKLAYSRMGINIWDVIEAAKTKPFGYMPFYPGPGLGGHCIPIDPFYLSWRARAFEIDTKFIELAGEVNRAMPRAVVNTLQDALNARFARAIKGARILIAGIAYKKNLDDLRESPALRIMEILQGLGAEVSYLDSFFPEIPRTREHANLQGMQGIAFAEESVSSFDAVMIATDHDCVDYESLVRWSKLVIDTRNATKSVRDGRDKIVLA